MEVEELVDNVGTVVEEAEENCGLVVAGGLMIAGAVAVGLFSLGKQLFNKKAEEKINKACEETVDDLKNNAEDAEVVK